VGMNDPTDQQELFLCAEWIVSCCRVIHHEDNYLASLHPCIPTKVESHQKHKPLTTPAELPNLPKFLILPLSSPPSPLLQTKLSANTLSYPQASIASYPANTQWETARKKGYLPDQTKHCSIVKNKIKRERKGVLIG